MANYKLSDEDEAMAREQFVRANQAWLREHTLPNGDLDEDAETADLVYIYASQLLYAKQGSPYARARIREALNATGIWPDQVSRPKLGELSRWWAQRFEPTPPYRPLPPPPTPFRPRKGDPR